MAGVAGYAPPHPHDPLSQWVPHVVLHPWAPPKPPPAAQQGTPGKVVSHGVSVRDLGLSGLQAQQLPQHLRWLEPAFLRWVSSKLHHVRSKAAAENPHKKARTSPYPGSKVEGSQVPDKKVSWQAEWPEYKPVECTASSVLAWPMWADPLVGDRNFSSKFNEEGGHVERKSQNGLYEVKNGRHRNPAGWPGLVGRGLLGWWGPNQAEDLILTKW